MAITSVKIGVVTILRADARRASRAHWLSDLPAAFAASCSSRRSASATRSICHAVTSGSSYGASEASIEVDRDLRSGMGPIAPL